MKFKESVQPRKIENKENWYTKYSAKQELGISLERMNAYITEYQQKEPDFVVIDRGHTYLYRSLINEIKERIKNGETEKIVPERYQTLQEFTDDPLINIEIGDPTEIIQYLFNTDKDIGNILDAQVDHFDRVKPNSDMVIKRGADIYWSPKFFSLLKNRISELQKIDIPTDSQPFSLLSKHGFEYAELYNKNKKDVYNILKEINAKYKGNEIVRIIDNKVISSLPPQALYDLDEKLSLL